MNNKNNNLFNHIFEDDAGDLEVERVLNLLSAYIEAELDGQNAALRFPIVAQYLQDVEEFKQEYEEIKAALVMVRQEKLVEPPGPSKFDINIFQQAAIANLWKEMELAGEKVKQLVEHIVVSLKKGVLEIRQMPDLVPVESIPLPQMRSDSTPAESKRFSLTSGEIVITIEMLPQNEDRLQLEVLVESEAKGPLPRQVIQLLGSDHLLLTAQATDNVGKLRFNDIKPDTYYLDIECTGQRRLIAFTIEN